MEQEMIQVTREEYEELLEEVGILRNPEMMEAIEEGIKAEKEGVQTWELDTHI